MKAASVSSGIVCSLATFAPPIVSAGARSCFQHGRRPEVGEAICSTSHDEPAPVLTTPQVYGNEFTGRAVSTPLLNSSNDKCCSRSTDCRAVLLPQAATARCCARGGSKEGFRERFQPPAISVKVGVLLAI